MIILLRSFIVCLCLCMPGLVFAQATGKSLGETTCAADGSSTQVFAANGARLTFTIINTSDTDVRLGYVSGSTTPDLTASNSILIRAGATYGESYPTVWLGRIVCMSTTGVTKDIQRVQTTK